MSGNRQGYYLGEAQFLGNANVPPYLIDCKRSIDLRFDNDAPIVIIVYPTVRNATPVTFRLFWSLRFTRDGLNADGKSVWLLTVTGYCEFS